LKIFVLDGLARSIGMFLPMIAGLICFWVYTRYIGKLSLGEVYSLLLLFNNLLHPIVVTLIAITRNSVASSSDKRVRELYKIEKKEIQTDDRSLEVG
jgi:hypothetical protein